MTMPTRRPRVRLLAACAIFALPFAVSAQTPAPAPQAPPPFRLGFGDMMSLAVQPNHIKLGIDGREKNWKLAAWQRDELDEAFRRLIRLYPTVDKRPVEPMMTMLKEPMDALKDAIKAENSKDFAAAYERLTQACNACHAMNEVEAIVIKVPTEASESLFPDQDFAPQK